MLPSNERRKMINAMGEDTRRPDVDDAIPSLKKRLYRCCCYWPVGVGNLFVSPIHSFEISRPPEGSERIMYSL